MFSRCRNLLRIAVAAACAGKRQFPCRSAVRRLRYHAFVIAVAQCRNRFRIRMAACGAGECLDASRSTGSFSRDYAIVIAVCCRRHRISQNFAALRAAHLRNAGGRAGGRPQNRNHHRRMRIHIHRHIAVFVDITVSAHAAGFCCISLFFARRCSYNILIAVPGCFCHIIRVLVPAAAAGVCRVPFFLTGGRRHHSFIVMAQRFIAHTLLKQVHFLNDLAAHRAVCHRPLVVPAIRRENFNIPIRMPCGRNCFLITVTAAAACKGTNTIFLARRCLCHFGHMVMPQCVGQLFHVFRYCAADFAHIPDLRAFCTRRIHDRFSPLVFSRRGNLLRIAIAAARAGKRQFPCRSASHRLCYRAFIIAVAGGNHLIQHIAAYRALPLANAVGCTCFCLHHRTFAIGVTRSRNYLRTHKDLLAYRTLFAFCAARLGTGRRHCRYDFLSMAKGRDYCRLNKDLAADGAPFAFHTACLGTGRRHCRDDFLCVAIRTIRGICRNRRH